MNRSPSIATGLLPFSLLSLLLPAVPALASGQYVVQPGAVATARACAVEAWHSDFGDADAVNLTCRGDAPVHATIEAGFPDGGSEEIVVEGHYQFLDAFAHGLDAGIFAGTLWDTGADRIAESTLIVPVTVQPVPDRLAVHFNLGAVHSSVSSETDAFWGTAAELRLFGPLTAVFETYGTGSDDPTLHGGLRLGLLDDRLIVDVSYLEEGEPGGASGWAAGAAFEVWTF